MERASQIAMVALGVLGVAAALSIARDIAAPVMLALALGVVLAPLTDRAERLGLSAVLAAMCSLLVALAVIAGILAILQPIAMALIAAAPKVMQDLDGMLSALRGLARSVTDLGSEVSSGMVSPASATEAENTAGEGSASVMPTITDALLLAPALLGQAFTFAGTLFFFLLGRGQIYDHLTQRLSAPDRRAVTSARLRDAEAQVSRYFLTITATNAALGLATGAALMGIGLPDATLWGALAFALNFIVFLGPAILAVGLFIAGVAVFDGPMVVLPAVTFLVLNMIEGQFVTPAVVGNRLSVNPLMVFLAIVLGIWLWGPIGGIVAIPVLLWIRVLTSGVAAETVRPPVPDAA